MTLYERTIREVQAKARSERYSPYFYALDFDVRPPSVANLPAEMTIAGVTKTPDFRYTGRSCSASGWPSLGYGPNLTLTNPSYTAPTYDTGSPLMGDIDGGVTGNGTGATSDHVVNFQGGTGDCDIGAKDVVFEVVLLWPAVAPTAAIYVVKKDSSGTVGWDARIANNRFEFYLSYSSSHICINSATMSTWPSVWSHAICFIDRSGSAQWYVNGSAWVSAIDVSSGVSWDCSTSAKPFCLLSPWTGGYGFNSALAYCALWSHSGWLNTHLQPTIAFDRFSQMQGLEAIVCPQGSSIPTTKTRASVAHLDKYESDGTRKLWQVSGSWLRGCERKDTGGVKRRGVLIEKAVVNYCLQSHTFNTGWTYYYCSVPTTSVLCPDGVTRTTCTLHEDTTAGQVHQVAYQLGLSATTAYVFSCWIKAVGRHHVRMCGDNANQQYFDVSNGTVGSASGNSVGYIEYWGNSWYRCWQTFTTGGSPSWTTINACSADAVPTCDGLDQDSLYIFGAQVELGSCPTSYIPTTTAAVTRYADSLIYRADVLPPDGQCKIQISAMDADRDLVDNTVMLCCSDGTENNMISLQHALTNDYPYLYINSGGVQQTARAASTDIVDGDEHSIGALCHTNLARIYVDGAQEGTDDTSVTVPVGLDRIAIGDYCVAGFASNRLLSKVRID